MKLFSCDPSANWKMRAGTGITSSQFRATTVRSVQLTFRDLRQRILTFSRNADGPGMHTVLRSISHQSHCSETVVRTSSIPPRVIPTASAHMALQRECVEYMDHLYRMTVRRIPPLPSADNPTLSTLSISSIPIHDIWPILITFCPAICVGLCNSPTTSFARLKLLAPLKVLIWRWTFDDQFMTGLATSRDLSFASIGQDSILYVQERDITQQLTAWPLHS
ncbi:hypothetical protein BJV78DRAFT_1235589 [Lactifluus subvellereus]|nr:hypothetical protein BJV78DRAFT_1235589 [Lactifluus subvellereus]